MRNAVAAQAVGDEALWLVLQPSEQAPEEAFGGRGIPPVLNQDVEHHTVRVDRAPEVVHLAIDFQEHLIEVPSVARLRPPPAELASEIGAELEAPLPYALVSDRDAPLGQEQFNVPETQAEAWYSQTAWLMTSAGKRYPGKVAGSDVIPPACLSHFVSARDCEVGNARGCTHGPRRARTARWAALVTSPGAEGSAGGG